MPQTYANGIYLIDGAPATDDVVAYCNAQIDAWAEELGRIAAVELDDGVQIAAIKLPLSRIEAFGRWLLRWVGELVTAAYTCAGSKERTEAWSP